MCKFKEISVFIVISGIITILSHYIGSDWLFKYLVANIITIQIAIITIVLTVFSFMFPLLLKISKLFAVKGTDKEVKIALIEQVINILLSILMVVAINSSYIDTLGVWIIYCLLLASLLFGLWQIYDTGNAVVEMYKTLKDAEINESTDNK